MRSKWIKGLAAIVFMLMFAIFMMHQLQEKLLFFPTQLPRDYQFRFEMPFEEWFLETAPNITINALLFKAEVSKGVVLYFHGNAGALDNWGFVAEDFVSKGYDILIVDYRGYGKSSGKLTKEADFHHDATVLYERLCSAYPEDHIILYGRSMGTGVAAKLAASHDPKMLILETPYYSLESLVKHYAPMLPVSILKYKLPTHQWLKEVKCPVFIIHGTNDEVIPYKNAARLKDIENPDLHFTTVPNAGHNNLSTFKEYHDFLNEALH